jgi:hypothetical protein
MSPALSLRIASVIAFLFAAGHSRGAPWTPSKDAAALAVVAAMKSFHLTVMGTDRTYWDFYYGFGLCIAVYLFALALILWQLGTLARHDAARLRPLMLTLAATHVVAGCLAGAFIFPLPALFGAAIFVCIAVAWFLAGRQPAAAGSRVVAGDSA